MARELPTRPGPVGARSLVLLAIALGGIGAGLAIGLFSDPAGLGEHEHEEGGDDEQVARPQHLDR